MSETAEGAVRIKQVYECVLCGRMYDNSDEARHCYLSHRKPRGVTLDAINCLAKAYNYPPMERGNSRRMQVIYKCDPDKAVDCAKDGYCYGTTNIDYAEKWEDGKAKIIDLSFAKNDDEEKMKAINSAIINTILYGDKEANNENHRL